MRDFLDRLDWTQILLYMLPVIGSLIAVWYRDHLLRWKDYWQDVFEGLSCVPSLRDEVEGILKHINSSGGGSLVDSMQRAEKALCSLTEQVDLVIQTTLVSYDLDDHVGRFHSNELGENTYVNQLYARWLGVGKSELLGWKWLNFIVADDVERVRRQWESCRAEHRQFRIVTAMTSIDRSDFPIEIIATPIPDNAPAKRWVGAVRRLEDGSAALASALH